MSLPRYNPWSVKGGDPHSEVLVKHWVLKSGQPPYLVLQTRLEIPGIDVGAVCQGDEQNAIDIFRVKRCVLFPGLTGGGFFWYVNGYWSATPLGDIRFNLLLGQAGHFP